MYKKKESRNMWVILDGNGHYASGIKEIDRGLNAYISYNTFGPECRGFLTLKRAVIIVGKLRSQSDDAGFDNTFLLHYLGIEEIIKDHKNFVGENMIIQYENITNLKGRNII